MLQRRRKVLLILETQPQKQLGFFGSEGNKVLIRSVCRSLRPAGWFLFKKIMQRKPQILFSTFATPLLSPHCLAKKPMSFSLAGTLSQGWFLYVFVLSPIAGMVPGRTKFVFRVPPKNLWEFPKLSPKEESLEIQRDVYCALWSFIKRQKLISLTDLRSMPRIHHLTSAVQIAKYMLFCVRTPKKCPV